MRVLALITLSLLIAVFLIGGTAPLGRALLAVGLAGLAADVFEEPAWRGVAHFQSGDYQMAAQDFAQARAFFNLGNAQAFVGEYAAALEAYDIAIAQGDARAKANFDVVAAYYAGLAISPDALGLFPKRKDGPKMESHVAEGGGRAAGTGDGVTNNNTMLGLAELDSRGQLGVRRVFDDQFMVADERWLLQLEDVPGVFLTERILQEHKRRAKLGLTPDPPEDPR